VENIETHFEQVGDGRVARVVIDRREKSNALNSGMIAKLTQAFEILAAAADLRAVVLSAAGGKAWVGGADVREMGALADAGAARAFIAALHGAMLAVRDLPVPVVAEIDGVCLGAGMELAAACDLRVASSNACFGMPEVQVGLPSVIEASLLPGLMGRGRAARLVLTGEVIDATRAEAWGFVEDVVAPDALRATVDALVSVLCKAGPNAVRAQKRLTRHWERVDPDTAAEDSVSTFGEAFTTGEPAEKLSAVFAGKK